jgi:hypothetical protein
MATEQCVCEDLWWREPEGISVATTVGYSDLLKVGDRPSGGANLLQMACEQRHDEPAFQDQAHTAQMRIAPSAAVFSAHRVPTWC